MYKENIKQWYINTFPRDSFGSTVLFSNGNGSGASNDNANNNFNIFPVLYLKSNVQIKSGEGTIEDPYQFSLKS